MGAAVELVGPAGSGKTTLYRALAARCPDVVAGVPFGRLGHLRHGLPQAARLAPAWLAAGGRFFDEKELRSLGYVAGWAAALERGAARGALAVFDHGPLFRIARLRAFGPPLVERAAFARWSAAAVRRWARLLGAVVWLDAPDALLAHRIDGRDERHRMKGGEVAETERFLGRYRAAYEALLVELRAAGGPEPIRVDTGREAPEAIAARVLTALGWQEQAAERHTRPFAATS
jgi:energy-coupling factor transporter ATP-binding protein EcfA2